ncbi:MAG TPA: TolC family protein [Myxococcales bacterium]|nr:TolC family protein [Myxococcales bacterium]
MMVMLATLLAAARVVTLEQAVESARQHQPQIRQAHAATDAANARAREAFAPMLPQVSAQAGYTRKTTNTSTVAFTPSSPNLFSDSISASQLIWDFGTSPYRWKSADAAADAQAANERAVGLQVDFTVRQAFFAARADRALVQVAQDNLTNTQAHLKQTEGFVQAGTHPEIDLLQARTDAANAQVQLINAQNTYETAKVTLNAAMGVLGPTDYDVSDESLGAVNDEDADAQPLFDEAMKTRPEVENIQKLVEADELTVRSYWGQYLPALSANAGLTQVGNSISDLTWNASVGVALSWNVFQGGLTRAQQQEAEANVQQEVAALDLLKQQLRSDVDSARLAVRAAKSSISAAQEALANAKVRLKLAEQRYQVGVGSAIELGDAQVALTQAAAQAVQADDNLATARAQLLRALGRQ